MKLCITLLIALSGSQLICGRQDAEVKISVDATHTTGAEIPQTIFGSFLEPIGNSTYNGLWAEIHQNPSFEAGLWSASNVERMIRDQPELAEASQLGLPVPWVPLDPLEGSRYEPRRGDAANSWESLAMFGLPGKHVGIKQRVYLPVPRELSYTGSIFVKHLSGPAVLDVSLRESGVDDQVLAHAMIDAPSPQWQKYTFHLTLTAGQVRALEPADFVIQVEGDERVLLDEANLMPDDALDGLDPVMVKMAKDMKTPLVRFGGNFTSGYHWRDGTGPIENPSACATTPGALRNTTLSAPTNFCASAN